MRMLQVVIIIFIQFIFNFALLADEPQLETSTTCQSLDSTSLYLLYQQNTKNGNTLVNNEILDDFFISQINENLNFKLEVFTSALSNKAFLDSNPDSIECIASEYLDFMTAYFQDGYFALPSYQETFFDIIEKIYSLKKEKLDWILTQSFVKIIDSYYAKEKLLISLQDLLLKIPRKLLDQIVPQFQNIKTFISKIPIEKRYELISKNIITQSDLVQLIASTSGFESYAKDIYISEKVTSPFFRNKYQHNTLSVINKMLETPLKISDVQILFKQFDIPTLLMLDSIDLKWRCSLGEKILMPFEIYTYSSEAMSLLDQIKMVNLDCIKTKFNEKKLFSSSEYAYFNKWCNEVKNFDLCTKYFSEKWISKLQRCEKDQDCIKVNPNKNQTLYYNSKNKGNDVLLFIKKYNFFIEKEVLLYSIPVPASCIQNSCRPDFTHCNPDKLFNEIISNLQSSDLNRCGDDTDCSLKEFSFPGVWRSYIIGLNNELISKNHKYTEMLFNQAINQCQNNIGNMYLNIQPNQDKAKVRPQCIKNFCGQVPLN